MNKQQSYKPFSLVREELINDIVQAVNKSGLSYVVLEYIFKDLLSEIHSGAVMQAQKEKDAYLQAQKKTDQEGTAADADK